ncbi:MAG: RNA methyltransferase [Desulfatiglans sp.]|jgi:tRNA/rRNA methyltransferase|nr:RNA methyltransferase [Thermodesulfobacteriota bacterium]MEE4351580.1 RNA methyltransferase [Desulfatiglans sp.]
MTSRVDLDHIAIVLVRPQIPENIGSAARAMSNMGFGRLVLVEPKNYDLSRVRRTATGDSVKVLENIEVHQDLGEALGPYHYIIGCTARTGSLRPAMTRPRRLAHDLLRISPANHVAILFGPEDCGLSNEDLCYCHTIAKIPTAGFSSLNLAQAVMIVCYEIFLVAEEIEPTSMPRLANSFELEGMYDHLKEVLMKIGFIDLQNPEHWMLNIRRFLSRLPLRAREVRIIRGMCRQVDWYARQQELKSLDEKK